VTVVPRTQVDLLHRVDGIPHVVLGPVLLVLAPLLGPALGVPVAALAGFLVAFVGYGALVLVLTSDGRGAAGLPVLAVKANLACLAAALLAQGAYDLTPLGSVVATLLAGSSAVVAWRVVRLAAGPVPA
jgi:hypothetical protein